MSNLKHYIITFKDSVSDADYSSVKDKIHKLGGSITNEYSLFKGFSAKFPSIHSSEVSKLDHVASIEEDGEVKTQDSK